MLSEARAKLQVSSQKFVIYNIAISRTFHAPCAGRLHAVTVGLDGCQLAFLIGSALQLLMIVGFRAFTLHADADSPIQTLSRNCGTLPAPQKRHPGLRQAACETLRSKSRFVAVVDCMTAILSLQFHCAVFQLKYR